VLAGTFAGTFHASGETGKASAGLRKSRLVAGKIAPALVGANIDDALEET
jgi:hypothetical protein